MQAAVDGAREIGFTIVSMTISLAAVFIPVLFMGGIIGRLLHEFAVTIGVAILVSGFVSLTLTPMLCSRFLRNTQNERHGMSVPGERSGLRRHAARLRLEPARGHGASARHHGAFAGDPGGHGVSVHGYPQGLPSQRRPGPALRVH